MPPTDESLFLKYLPLAFSLVSLVVSILSYYQSVRTVRVSQRAYVYHTAELMNQDELLKAVATKASVVPVELVFNIKNYGTTPALKLNYTFSYTIPARTTLNIQKDRLSDVDIPAHETRQYLQRLEFTSSMGGRLAEDRIYTGVTGKVSYEDVFGKKHEVSLCYVIIATCSGVRVSTCQQEETGKIPELAKPTVQGGVIVGAK